MGERVFTAHMPIGADPARTLLVDDRWRWGAFLVPLIWALWGRHWLLAAALFLWNGALIALAATGGGAAAAVLDFSTRLILGWEAAVAVRIDRSLRGWRPLGCVSADSAAAAELAWFGASEPEASA